MTCTSCGKTLSNSSKFCNHCGKEISSLKVADFVQRAEAISPNKPVSIWLKLLAGLAVLAILVGAGSRGGDSNKAESHGPHVEDCGKYDIGNVDAKVTAEMVLKDWQDGKSSAAWWVGGIERKKLYAVQGYQFQEGLHIPDPKSPNGSKPHASAYSFRVSSATQGGFPITKDWAILVQQVGNECRVYDLEEND